LFLENEIPIIISEIGTIYVTSSAKTYLYGGTNSVLLDQLFSHISNNIYG